MKDHSDEKASDERPRDEVSTCDSSFPLTAMIEYPGDQPNVTVFPLNPDDYLDEISTRCDSIFPLTPMRGYPDEVST